MNMSFLRATMLALLGLPAPLCAAELNLYSSRHYETDERLYSNFEEATGITINRIEGKADEMITRIQAEGVNSPADVLLTVDTSRIERAKKAGILQPIESDELTSRIPEYLRDDDNQWFAFSQRARIIFYNNEKVSAPPLTYADLADERFKGMLCVRSGKNVYMQTMLAAIISHEGEEKARDWARAVASNFARDPQGGDTDQLRGIVSGECMISVSNTYYFARALRRQVKGLSDNTGMISWVFPDQNGHGAHMNLSAGAVAKHAPNRANAIRFLEYLASDQAQQYFSAGNDEYPAVPGVALSPSVAKLGFFKPDDINLSEVAKNVPVAQKIFHQVGWE